jgi:phage replication O-like protein O
MKIQSDNFTKVPNEFLKAIASSRVFCARIRIVASIIRKTQGWNKKEDWISLSQFEAMTGIGKSNVCRTINQLIKAKILACMARKQRSIYPTSS